MTWIQIDGKKYYMVEQSLNSALIFTVTDIRMAQERFEKLRYRKYKKIWSPLE